jgi:hypothetical protein
MKTPMLIVLTVLMLGVGGALAAMNNACKSTIILGVHQISAFGIT